MLKTTEECPVCKNPEAECEHLGNYQHFWHCDDCEDDWLAVVGYECEVCPTQDAQDGAKRPLTGRNGKPTNVLADGTVVGGYCVCKHPIAEDGFCFVCQSPLRPAA